MQVELFVRNTVARRKLMKLTSSACSCLPQLRIDLIGLKFELFVLDLFFFSNF